jgi:TctA family transporter
MAAMMLGFALAAVGLDSRDRQLRMTFGIPELLKGFDFLVAVIGLFGIGEILLTMEEGLVVQGQEREDQLQGRAGRPGASCRGYWRSSCAPRWSAAGWASRPAAPRRRRS